MRAIVRDAYGSPDVLSVDEIPLPEITDDQVLVRVRAAAVDRGAWHLMAGRPYLVVRPAFGARRPRARTLGLDLARVVESVGRNVTGLRPGDEVFGTGNG